MRTKIDADVYERLVAEGLSKWSAQKVGKRYYVSRTVNRKGKLYLHRWIMDAPRGLVIDHIDNDPLNNTRENLRICYHRDNARNKPGKANRLLAGFNFKGVGKFKNGASWSAQIQIGGEHVCLGRFEHAADAAKMYDFAATILFGEFAYTNFANSVKFLKLRKIFIKELGERP